MHFPYFMYIVAQKWPVGIQEIQKQIDLYHKYKSNTQSNYVQC